MKSDRLYTRGFSKSKYIIRGLVLGFCMGFLVAVAVLKIAGSDAISPDSEDSSSSTGNISQDTGLDAGSDVDKGVYTASDIERITYIVKEGDTLSKIAAAYGTTTRSILILNNLDDANTIYVGQELIVQDELPSYYYAIVEDDVVRIATNKIDGSGEEILLSAKVFSDDPVVELAPNRKKILYTEDTISGGSGALTYISDLDGSNRQEMVSSELSFPADLGQTWSPDSFKVAYAFENNLWIFDITTRQRILVSDTLRPLVTGNPGYAWDSKGDRIAFVGEDGSIGVHDYVSGNKEIIENLEVSDVRQIIWPFGNYLYFVLSGEDSPELFRYSILAPTAEQITDNDFEEERVVFLRDSDRFLFAVSDLGSSARSGEEGVWYVDSDRQQKQLFVSQGTYSLPLAFDQKGENAFVRSGDRIFMVNLNSLSQTLIGQGDEVIFLGD